MKQSSKFLLSGLALAALVACGGGASDQQQPNLVLTGTAATGLAMSNATITAKCVMGLQSGQANAGGAYTLNIENGVLPCVLQATSSAGDTSLYSMTGSSGTSATANITPITHAVVARALGDEAAVAAAFAQANPEQLRTAASQLASALAAVRVALTDVADYAQDPFTTPFVAAHTGSNGVAVSGDAFDAQLDALQETLQTSQSTLSELVHAIATSQGGSDDAPAANVVGVLTPPASATCPALRSGQYVVASQRGEMGAPGTYNAANATWTDNNVSVTAEVQTSDCSLILKSAGQAWGRMVLSNQGLGIWRAEDGQGVDFGLLFPYQRNTLADLAGNWNMVAFDRDDTANNPLFGFGKAKINSNGSWETSNCPTTAGTAACEAWKPESHPFTVVNGRFDNVGGHGYLFKAPNGTKLYVHSFGEEFGIVVAAQPHNLSLPAVNSSVSFWDVSGSLQSVSPLSVGESTIASVDAAAQSYTRTNGTVRFNNKPAEGMSYRPATNQSSPNIYLHAKGLITVYGREKTAGSTSSFVGFSISK